MSVKQLWRWQGVNDKGQLEQDVVWADNRLALIITLQHQRIMPLRIKRMGVNAALWKEEQSAEIIHQLATLIHAGLTLSEGLELLAKQHPHRQWQALLRTLAHELEQGVPFFQRISLTAAGISAALPDDDPHRRTDRQTGRMLL